MPSANRVLYKYYGPERVDVLERRMIYFSHPSSFNDPYETLPYVDQASPFYSLGWLYESRRTAATLPAEIRPKIEQLRREELHKHTLIFSVSQEGDNLLLWSHYAAGHAGFAIGFRSGTESFHQRLDGTSRRLQRVNYSYLRPAVNTVDERREQDMLLTKSSHWQYEKEWRMFESAFNADENEPIRPGVWGFRLDPASVDRVVLGARITTEADTRILAALDHPDFDHVVRIRAYLDDDEFAVKHRLIDSATGLL